MELKAYLYEFGALVDFLSPEKREVFRRINHEYLLMLNKRNVEEMQAIIWDGIQANVNSVRKQFLKNQVNGTSQNDPSDFEIPIDVAMHLNLPVQNPNNDNFQADIFESSPVSSEAIVSKELTKQALRDVREALIADKEHGKWLLIAAFKQLNKAIRLDEQNYKAHFNYAWLCNFFFRNPAKAEQHFEKAIQYALEQDSCFTVFTLRHLAETRRELKKYDAAVQAAYEAFMLDRNQTPQIRFDMARYLTLAGEHQKAANYLELLIREFPEYYWQIRVEPDFTANSYIETFLDQYPAAHANKTNGNAPDASPTVEPDEEHNEILLAKRLEENRQVNESDQIFSHSSDDNGATETGETLSQAGDTNQIKFTELEPVEDTAGEIEKDKHQSADVENAGELAEKQNNAAVETVEKSEFGTVEETETPIENEAEDLNNTELSQISAPENETPLEIKPAEIELPIDFSTMIRNIPVDMETDILDELNTPENANFIFAPASAFTGASQENDTGVPQITGETSDEVVDPIDETTENLVEDISQPIAETPVEPNPPATGELPVESMEIETTDKIYNKDSEALNKIEALTTSETEMSAYNAADEKAENEKAEDEKTKDAHSPENVDAIEMEQEVDQVVADPEIVDLLSNIGKNLPDSPDVQEDVFIEDHHSQDATIMSADENPEISDEQNGETSSEPDKAPETLSPKTLELLEKIEQNSMSEGDDPFISDANDERKEISEKTVEEIPPIEGIENRLEDVKNADKTSTKLADESQNLLSLIDFKEISAPQQNETTFTFDENMPDGYEQAAEKIRQEMELALQRCEKLGSFFIRRDLEKTVERIELIGETSIEKLRNIPEADWKRFVHSSCKQLRRQVDKFRNRHKILSRLKRA